MKELVIVIPGLGSNMVRNRIEAIVRRWERPNRPVQIFNSNWSSNESFDQKLSRLIKQVDGYKGAKISVVAFSAGGALATSLLDRSSNISKVILISSKIKGSNTIGVKYQKRASALIDAVKASENSIARLPASKKEKIICLKPIFDEVVPKKDMCFEGVETKLTPFLFHVPSIAIALLFQVKRLLKD